jgi:hypothetical protein
MQNIDLSTALLSACGHNNRRSCALLINNDTGMIRVDCLSIENIEYVQLTAACASGFEFGDASVLNTITLTGDAASTDFVRWPNSLVASVGGVLDEEECKYLCDRLF